MKRFFYIYTFLLLLAGCTKSETNDSTPLRKLYSPKFYAAFGSSETRSYLDEDMHQRWHKGDSVSVFTSLTNQFYKFEGETGDNQGVFSAVSTGQEEGDAVYFNNNYAIYPYSYNHSITQDGTIMLTLPTDQSYAENSFAVGANPMVAVTSSKDDTDLRFQNLCGFLRLRLYGDDVTIRNIEVRGHREERLAGRATVKAEYGKDPQLTMDYNDYSWGSINLHCGEEGVKIGSTPEEATDFWVVLPPTILENGFYIYLYDIHDGFYHNAVYDRFTIERNVVKTMAPLKVAPNTLKTGQYTYYIGTQGGTLNIDAVLSGTLSVEIPEQYQDWISYIEPTRGIHSETAQFEIKPLTDGTERFGEIHLISNNEYDSRWHTISIHQTDEIITVDKKRILSYWGGEFDIEIRSDIEFEVINPDVNWLHPKEEKDLPKNILRYQYDENRTYDSRETQILITDKSNNKTDTLTVIQQQRDALVLDENRFWLNSKGGDIEVSLGHNVEYEIEISDEWITQKVEGDSDTSTETDSDSETRAEDETEIATKFTTDKLVFTIAPNTSFISRRGTIKFISKKDSYQTQTVEIEQAMDNAFDPSIDGWEDDDDEYGGTAE